MEFAFCRGMGEEMSERGAAFRFFCGMGCLKFPLFAEISETPRERGDGGRRPAGPTGFAPRRKTARANQGSTILRLILLLRCGSHLCWMARGRRRGPYKQGSRGSIFRLSVSLIDLCLSWPGLCPDPPAPGAGPARESLTLWTPVTAAAGEGANWFSLAIIFRKSGCKTARSVL